MQTSGCVDWVRRSIRIAKRFQHVTCEFHFTALTLSQAICGRAPSTTSDYVRSCCVVHEFGGSCANKPFNVRLLHAVSPSQFAGGCPADGYRYARYVRKIFPPERPDDEHDPREIDCCSECRFDLQLTLVIIHVRTVVRAVCHLLTNIVPILINLLADPGHDPAPPQRCRLEAEES